jgi:UDP-glucose 4-epimerase
MAKILITGDKGFIGSYLSKELDHQGFDIKDGRDILVDELPDADIVIHLAAQTSVIDSLHDPLDDARTNILGTIRLAQKYKQARFIFASSGGAIQETIESPYGLSKFCAEEYIKMLCEDYVILRFPNIYGDGSKSVVDKFIQKPINIYGDGTSTRDYVHVSDLVVGILASIEWQTGTYSLGSGKNTSVLDIAKATGKPITHIHKIPGELQYSYVKNTAPGWKPTVDVLDYVRSKL